MRNVIFACLLLLPATANARSTSVTGDLFPSSNVSVQPSAPPNTVGAGVSMAPLLALMHAIETKFAPHNTTKK